MATKHPRTDQPLETTHKLPKLVEGASASSAAEQAIVPVSSVKDVSMTDAAAATPSKQLMVPVEPKRLVLEGNPQFFQRLKQRREIGFRRSIGKKKHAVKSYEIDVDYFRTAVVDVLRRALNARYYTDASMRANEIRTEVTEFTTVIADMCMSALYAKLRNINKTYGRHGTRYTTAPSYSKEIELPLPIALAIQEFGVFQTQAMEDNYVVVPTYPEGTQNEGRSSASYPSAEYQSFIPTLKDLGIQLKAIDSRVKTGSAWWTYKVKNEHNATDLLCTLPRSHYSDQSAILRSLFCSPAPDNTCKDLIKLPTDIIDYGTLMNEMPPGTNLRSFLALIHGAEEEWSHGTS